MPTIKMTDLPFRAQYRALLAECDYAVEIGLVERVLDGEAQAHDHGGEFSRVLGTWNGSVGADFSAVANVAEEFPDGLVSHSGSVALVSDSN
jgi:hypothetical protein